MCVCMTSQNGWPQGRLGARARNYRLVVGASLRIGSGKVAEQYLVWAVWIPQVGNTAKTLNPKT